MPKLQKQKNQASLWRRSFAFIIDLLIINLIVVYPFNSMIKKSVGDISDKSFIELYKFLSTSSAATQSLQHALLIISIVSAVLALFYFSILEFKLKQTIGKILFKVYISSTTEKLKFSQCLVRNITKAFFFTQFFLVFVIDVIYLLFSKTKQRFFEKISNTIVTD